MFTRFHSYSLSCQTLDGISSVQMHRLTLFDPVQYQTWLRLKLWTPSTRVLDWAEKTEAQCYRMLPHATAKSKSSPLHIHQKSSKWLEHILKWIKAKASDLAHLQHTVLLSSHTFFSCEMIPKWVSFVFFILKFVASHLLMSFQNPKLPNIEIFGMFRISWIP